MVAEPKDLPHAELGEAGVSKLEKSLITTDVPLRPNSREMNDVNRHAEKSDLKVQDLDFDFRLDSSHYPLMNIRSLQQVFKAVQFNQHLTNERNFSEQTSIECLEVTQHGANWQTLDENSLRECLQDRKALSDSFLYSSNDGSKFLSPSKGFRDDEAQHSLQVFLMPLQPTPQTSFGSRAAMTRSSVLDLFNVLQIDPFFLLNMIGRPDYWSPWSNWDSDTKGQLVACDFACQHPRWNLQVQGAPVSVYMRYDNRRKMTTYIISHKYDDSSVGALKDLLNTAIKASSEADRGFAPLLDDPFDIHVILSTLSFEASKFHVKRFQRFMWAQINKVDDHLAGLETSDRAKLGDLTKQLQVISQNADSHLASADVCIITAIGIRDAHARFNPRSGNPFTHQQVRDSIDYVVKSMQKQKIWFLNYKNRKDSTMSLVYNLVTQQDAANNIELAADMKQDSTSMSAIATLTMAFLPGTFTASVLGAGVLTSDIGPGIHASSVWWIWLAVSVPLTLVVMLCWWWYKQKKNQIGVTQTAPSESRPPIRRANSSTSFFGKTRSFSLGGFSFSARP